MMTCGKDPAEELNSCPKEQSVELISIDREKCNKDGLCASECPPRIIVMDGKEGYPVPTPDFKDFCREENIQVLGEHYLGRTGPARFAPNFFALNAIFVISKS